MSRRGSRNHTSCVASIHGGTFSGGLTPLKDIEKLSHATSPRGVESIVSYKSRWLANGGASSCLIKVAAQRSRRVLICPADIWLRIKRNSAVSNATRLA